MSKNDSSKAVNPKEILMLGYLCSKDLPSLPAKVEVLDRFELSGEEISRICGCALQSVSDARQRLKKQKKSEKPF